MSKEKHKGRGLRIKINAKGHQTVALARLYVCGDFSDSGISNVLFTILLFLFVVRTVFFDFLQSSVFFRVLDLAGPACDLKKALHCRCSRVFYCRLCLIFTKKNTGMERSGQYQPLSTTPAGPVGAAQKEHLLLKRNASALGLHHATSRACRCL